MRTALIFTLTLGLIGLATAQGTMPCDVTRLQRPVRLLHTVTLLQDGTVLLAGGTVNGQRVNTAERYDPASGRFKVLTLMPVKVMAHVATLLMDGKVLLTGGYDEGGYSNQATLFDPSSGSFISIPRMNAARWSHTATLLPSGQVLITGGRNDFTALSSAEIFDPASNTFTPLTPHDMTSRRYEHAATLLANGKVLIAGGNTWNGTGGNVVTNTAELFDPTTQTFSPLPIGMISPRDTFTATLLSTGKVLLAGGNGTGTSTGVLNTAEMFDPESNTFILLSHTMQGGHSLHTATSLSSGEVLIVGGLNAGAWTRSAEIFDPALGAFTSLPPMASTRVYPTATLLKTGQVLFDGPGMGDELFDLVSRTFALLSPTAICSIARSLDQRVFLQGTTIPNRVVTLQACTDLTLKFSTIGQVTSNGYGEFEYVDGHAPFVDRQFYRALVE